MKEQPVEVEECVYEGRVDGVFKGFRNHDTLFKVQGGGTWRQDEYRFEYHYLFSPKVRILRLRNTQTHKEDFFMEVDGVKTRIKVRSAYV